MVKKLLKKVAEAMAVALIPLVIQFVSEALLELKKKIEGDD